MYFGLHEKCPLLLSDFNKARVFSTDCQHSNTKFHENSSRGTRVVPCRQTDMTKLTVAFSNFANAPKSKVYKMNNLKLEETLFRNTLMFCSKTEKQMFSCEGNFYFCVFLNLLGYSAQTYRHQTHAHTLYVFTSSPFLIFFSFRLLKSNF
jgi:hypothetical protein